MEGRYSVVGPPHSPLYVGGDESVTFILSPKDISAPFKDSPSRRVPSFRGPCQARPRLGAHVVPPAGGPRRDYQGRQGTPRKSNQGPQPATKDRCPLPPDRPLSRAFGLLQIDLYSAYGSPCTTGRRGHFTLPIPFGGVVLAPRTFLKFYISWLFDSWRGPGYVVGIGGASLGAHRRSDLRIQLVLRAVGRNPIIELRRQKQFWMVLGVFCASPPGG